jgi:predicted nucleic acid-binding protein
MRLLLDTNIVIDVLSKREGYADSLAVLRYCEIGRAEGYVSATTVTDVMYIMRKRVGPGALREAVRTLLTIVDVAGVLKGDIHAAFSGAMTDFEDAVQASCAARMKADCIVTRNIKDFEQSPVSAALPQDILKLLISAPL